MSTYHHLRAQEDSAQPRPDSLIRGELTETILWEAVWKSKVMPKVRMFIWKLLSKAIAVREGLAKRGIHVEVGCPMCNNAETVEHLVLECDGVKLV